METAPQFQVPPCPEKPTDQVGTQSKDNSRRKEIQRNEGNEHENMKSKYLFS